MDKTKIKQYLIDHESKKTRTIVIIDFGNVEKWKESLGWSIGVGQLANLVKSLTTGQKYLRRFYYGADYGPSESGTELTDWSRSMLEKAEAYSLQVVKKRVKYIHTGLQIQGYEYQKKCDLDVEMAIDLVRERDRYDTIVLFSGDGDLSYALRYMHDNYKKECIVFGARNHIGREMIDAKEKGVISEILYAEDFEYRLNLTR